MQGLPQIDGETTGLSADELPGGLFQELIESGVDVGNVQPLLPPDHVSQFWKWC